MDITPKNNRLEMRLVTLEIIDDIVFAVFKKGITITLEGAREIIEKRVLFTGKNFYPMLFEDEGAVSIEKGARDYLSNEGTEGLTAGAFILRSIYSTFLINFYLSVNPPKVPSKMFTDRAKAIEWLEQYKPNRSLR